MSAPRSSGAAGDPAGAPGWHAHRAAELAEQALQPGTRMRRARLFASVAQVHATLATGSSSAAAPARPVGAAFEPKDSGRSVRRRGVPAPRVTPAEIPSTLFERLKGQDGIAQVVQEFYTRVLRDPQLTHYFEGVAMWRLQRHMVAFLVQATGGPGGYDGREMASAHAHLHITGRDFDRVARHLVETLIDFGVAGSDVDEVVAAITPIRSHVVTAVPEPAPPPDGR